MSKSTPQLSKNSNDLLLVNYVQDKRAPDALLSFVSNGAARQRNEPGQIKTCLENKRLVDYSEFDPGCLCFLF